jgi:hypothetical protein
MARMTGLLGIKRCGSCFFAEVLGQDITKRLCYGAPPSAIQISAPTGKMTLQMARPVVSVSDRACSLYQDKGQHDVDALQFGASETKQ